MKIGFVSLYPFRPHVEHVFFLSSQFKEAGHEVFFLDCLGKIETCYNIEMKKSSKLAQCAACVIGGLRSFTHGPFETIRNYPDLVLSFDELESITASSSATLNRIEDYQEFYSSEIVEHRKKLHRPVNSAYLSAKKWISGEKLDCVIVFNGRMEVAAGVLRAAQELSIKWLTVERTWFGHGLQLNFGENCLGLRDFRILADKYSAHPLTAEQCSKAASYVVSRFYRNNKLEWRQFNTEFSSQTTWPIADSYESLKVLIVPSSINEIMFHPDWSSEWKDFRVIFGALIEQIRLSGKKVSTVMRGHPIWNQKIGQIEGNHISEYYKKWAIQNNVGYVDPGSNLDTLSLIKLADVIIVNGGSAAYEAAILGKKVINVGRCQYDSSGFTYNLKNWADLSGVDVDKIQALDPKEIVRSVLRFIYTYANRYAFFSDSIVAQNPTSYVYRKKGFDIDRLVQMITSGELIPDDEAVCNSTIHENRIIEKLLNNDFEDFKTPFAPCDKGLTRIERRPLYSQAIKLRDFFPRG
jgi:hypothetical protein